MQLIDYKPFHVSSLEKINKILRNEPVKPGFIFYGKRYSIQYNQYERINHPNNQIFIIRPTSILNGWLYESYFGNEDLIVNIFFCTYNEKSGDSESYGLDINDPGLDIEVTNYKNELFIESWYIQDLNFLKPHYKKKEAHIRSHENVYPKDKLLSDDEIMELVKSLIHFIKTVAKKQNNNKIVMEVCEDIYTKFFEKEGFVPTGDKILFGSLTFIMKIELILDKDYCVK